MIGLGCLMRLQRPNERPSIKVLIAAEVRLYREGLANTLASRKQLAVVGAAGGRDEVLSLVASQRPQVVVLDMSTRDSLELLNVIGRDAPDVKVIAFAVENSDGGILACAEARVAGYLPWDSSTNELVTMIEAVTSGDTQCSPRIIALLLERLASLAQRGRPELMTLTMLTPRQREILTLIREGLSNKEIAVRLVIEVATVKNHVHNILEKLHVSTRSEAVARVSGISSRRTSPATPFAYS